ncbi:hypothetical protein [Polyangium sp. 15x6]|uniref:hypothetical protein n=1 Tax=Polyangium sp. 15x6 TaxID=3042687 RepID=UPI00249C51A4|nr:hypothetical protein [Polyangium sp. 15x6]MDI3286841.1 hypothetical protein [Polyangium sp. 15x6]
MTTEGTPEALESAPGAEIASLGGGMEQVQIEHEDLEVGLQSSVEDEPAEETGEPTLSGAEESGAEDPSSAMCYSTSGSSFGMSFVCNALWTKLKAYCGIDGVAQYGVCDCSCNSLTKWCSCSTYVCCNG